jgi:transcriptional regulator with XRE-family HTH domain
MEKIDFADWLRAEIEERGWSQSDLARTSKISPTQIARILSRERNAGNEAIVAIAHAFKLPPEQVYRAAGILPPAPEINEIIEQILHETQDMPEMDQQEILAFIRMKNNLRASRKK